MSTLTEAERQQVEQARADAEAQAKEAIAQERAARRMSLDEANAVEGWVWCWVHVDLRHFARKGDVPWPPRHQVRLEPRTAELENYTEVEGEKAERNWARPGDLWIGHHRIDARPGRSGAVAIEAHPTVPYRADWYGLWVQVALFGEVERFTRPGKSERWVTRHGLGYVREAGAPNREMWRGTRARVTGVAAPRETDEDTAYLHFSHWWFDNGRKYPTTERVKPRSWLVSEVAELWGVPTVGVGPHVEVLA